MYDDLWRLNVELKSRHILKEFAKTKKWSGRELARQAGLGHAIVLHLMNGERSRCSKATADAIEDALGCPRGLLFETSVSTVSASNGRRELVRS